MNAGAAGTMVRRNDSVVKIDTEILRKARVVAAYLNISVAEYLSGALGPIVERDLREHARKAMDDEHKPKKPKG